MLSGNQVVTQFQSFTPTGCYRATINPQTDLANFRSYAVKPNNLTAQPSNNYLQFKQYKPPSQSFSSSALPTNHHLNLSENIQDSIKTPKKNNNDLIKTQGNSHIQPKKKNFFHKTDNKKQTNTVNQPTQLKAIVSKDEVKRIQKVNISINQIQKKKIKSPLHFTNKAQNLQNKPKNIVNYRVSQIPINSNMQLERSFRKQEQDNQQRNQKDKKKLQELNSKHAGDSFGPNKKKLRKIFYPQLSISTNNLKRKQNLSITPTKFNVHKSPANPLNTMDKSTINQKPSFFTSKKSINKFHLIRLIGKSKYSSSYLAIEKKILFVFCIKIINKSALKQSPQFMQQFIRKINLQYRLNHPNIIQIYDLFSDSENIYLIQQYMQGGSLRDYMQKQRNKSSVVNYQQEIKKQSSIMQKLYGINSALLYIHNNQIQRKANRAEQRNFTSLIHGDLRPQTILISIDSCKISPLNISKIQKSVSLIHTYIPPEAVGGQNLTSKSDMWNLGMLLFELFSNRPLFKVPSKDYDLGLADQILNTDFNKQLLSLHFVSHSLKDLIRCLLKIRPCQRISSADVMNIITSRIQSLRGQQAQKKNKTYQAQIQKFKTQLKSQSFLNVKKRKDSYSIKGGYLL